MLEGYARKWNCCIYSIYCILALLGHFYLYYNGVEMQKDREFATYIVNVLPVGIKGGILLAGVLSAAMSTLSSSINSLASSTLIDWFKKSDNLRLSKLFSFIWAIVLIGIALIFDEGDKAIVIVGLQISILYLWSLAWFVYFYLGWIEIFILLVL